MSEPEFEDVPWSMARFWDMLLHLWVPVVVLGTAGTAFQMRTMRATLLDEVNKMYVTAARAGGLSEFKLLMKYPVRVALNPLISTIGWVLPLVALLLVIGAIWVYPNNRWMVAFLAFGTALVGLLGLVLLRVTESTLLGNVSEEVAREAGDAVFDIATTGIRAATWALIVLALIIGFFAWANGPSPRAQSLKSSAIAGIGSRRRAPEEEPSEFATFLADWKRTIQVIVVLLGMAYIIFGPSPSGISVLLTAVVVSGIAVFVEVLAGSAEAPVPAPQERVDA